MQNNDRRRLNAPAGNTTAPSFHHVRQPAVKRSREPQEHRKIFLRTGVVPSAAGSAYYEIQRDEQTSQETLIGQRPSSLKLTVTVHGPRPLPRNAAFSPNLLLSTHIKFAPFATHVRRGYVRDASERDLGVHLEAALRGVIIGDRWPKGAVDVVVTVLEGEDEGSLDGNGDKKGWGMMSVLAGAITASSAALAEAGIDCVDLVSGGVAGLVKTASKGQASVVVDPAPAEHNLEATCVVAYLQSRDEITELWMRGDAGSQLDELIEQATVSARLGRGVLVDAVSEAVEADTSNTGKEPSNGSVGASKSNVEDAKMAG